MKLRVKREASFVAGCLYMLTYLALTAFTDVYAGRAFQTIDPLHVIFWSFLFSSLFFCVEVRNSFDTVRTNTRTLILLNISTAIGWGSFFFSLKYLQPVLVAVVSCTAAPLVSLIFFSDHRSRLKYDRWEMCSIVVLFLSLLFIIWISVSGKTGLGPGGASLVGVVLAFVCGAALIFSSRISKQLSSRLFTPGQILALRFWLLMGLAAVLLVIKSEFKLPEAAELVPIISIALISNVGALWFLQRAIPALDTVTVGFFFALGPACVIPFELADERIRFSSYSYAACMIVVLVSVVGVYIGYLKERRS